MHCISWFSKTIVKSRPFPEQGQKQFWQSCLKMPIFLYSLFLAVPFTLRSVSIVGPSRFQKCHLHWVIYPVSYSSSRTEEHTLFGQWRRRGTFISWRNNKSRRYAANEAYFTPEPGLSISCKIACVTSEILDQPVHQRSLSESSWGTLWVANDLKHLRADSEVSDQPAHVWLTSAFIHLRYTST